MIITFCGHSVVKTSDKLKERIKELIRDNTSDSATVTFYLGGYGDFDRICAIACKEIKEERAGVELVYVTPYIDRSAQIKIKDMQNCGLCDATVYPPIENVPPRFAILKRNEWMISNSDLIIAYVNQSYGGAYRSFQTAKRKKKRVINICDLE